MRFAICIALTLVLVGCAPDPERPKFSDGTLQPIVDANNGVTKMFYCLWDKYEPYYSEEPNNPTAWYTSEGMPCSTTLGNYLVKQYQKHKSLDEGKLTIDKYHNVNTKEVESER